MKYPLYVYVIAAAVVFALFPAGYFFYRLAVVLWQRCCSCVTNYGIEGLVGIFAFIAVVLFVVAFFFWLQSDDFW